MKLTTTEQVLLDTLGRTIDDYRSMERNEYPGSDNDRSRFELAVLAAQNVIKMRAIARDKRGGESR